MGENTNLLQCRETGNTMIAKIGQAKHMGKWEPHVAMIRLVRDLQGKIEDGETLNPDELTDIDNIINGFLGCLPTKVFEEVRHG